MDRLTGLADRGEFARSFPTLFAQERISVALFDVDNLRALNDRDGHKAVDQVLVRLGSLMQERCGAGEMAARVGGDEFALALLEDEPIEVVQEVERIRGRFADETGATLSVGICDGKTLRRAAASLSLFEGAGRALVDAKKRGPGGLSFFDIG